VGCRFPAVANVLLALIILGFYGLEDKWAFPLAYWAIQLLAIVLWVTGMGAALQFGFSQQSGG